MAGVKLDSRGWLEQPINDRIRQLRLAAAGLSDKRVSEITRWVQIEPLSLAEVDEATRRQIRRGERLRAVLTQPANQPVSLASEAMVLLAAGQGFLDGVALSDVSSFEQQLLGRVEDMEPDLVRELDRTGELTSEMQDRLDAILVEFTGVRSGSQREADAPSDVAAAIA